MTRLFSVMSSILKALRVIAVITITSTISFVSYHLYEISVYGDPTMAPSSRTPLFLLLGGFIAALGFLIASIFRNQKMRIFLERLTHQEQENATQRARIKKLENTTPYEFSEFMENPFNP